MRLCRRHAFAYDYGRKVIYYFEDVDESGVGTLYRFARGESMQVAGDVAADSLRKHQKLDQVIFLRDVTHGVGTLCVFSGKEAKTVSDGVELTVWSFTADGDIRYMKDWDAYLGGEVCRFNGRTSDRISSDVQAVVNIVN